MARRAAALHWQVRGSPAAQQKAHPARSSGGLQTQASRLVLPGHGAACVAIVDVLQNAPLKEQELGSACSGGISERVARRRQPAWWRRGLGQCMQFSVHAILSSSLVPHCPLVPRTPLASLPALGKLTRRQRGDTAAHQGEQVLAKAQEALKGLQI